MSKELATTKPAELDRFDDPGMLQTLKDTVCKGATDSQFRLFIEVCRATGLNPFIREIWFVPGVGVMAGRDGYLAAANRHPMFDGMETLVERDTQGIPVKATCKVWRKDRSHPITCEAYYNEYKKASSVWTTYKSAMIGKVAEVLALKRSFSINGIVTEEEIGEQGNQNGSREAQRAVADELIEQGARQLEATKEAIAGKKELSTDYKTLTRFKTAKGKVGDEDYYRILRMFGAEHANEITDPAQAQKCLKAFAGWLQVSEPWVKLQDRDAERFNALLKEEDCLSIADALAHPDSDGILTRIQLAMSVAAKPKATMDKLLALSEGENANTFWHVAGNNGIGNAADLAAMSLPAQDKLLALVQAEIELGV